MIRVLTWLFVFLAAPGAAWAGGGGGLSGGATELTQLANNTQLTLSYIEQANQTVTQINQYATMLRNLMKLNPAALVGMAAKKLWNDQGMNETFRNLYSVYQGGQKIAYSLRSLDANFKQLNPGYGNYGNGFDFQSAYRNWSDSTRGAALGSLRMAAVQADDLQTEGDLVQTLSDQSSTADGQLAALQAGNQIGVAMIGQMQKLRQLQMAQIQAQNTAALAAQGRQEAGDEMLRQVFQGTRTRVRTYEEIVKDRGGK